MRKILNGCYTACGVVSGLALVGIVAFVLIQIVARPLGLVVSWSAEFAGYAMAASSFMGLAYTSMKPQASYKGNWYELQPLGTEGQGTSIGGDKYNTNIFAMPLGVGIKFNIYAIFGFSMEWGVRRTFTDYFDDISGKYVDPEILQDENGTTSSVLADQSLTKARADGSNTGLQRGDPGRKDLYFFALGSLNIRIDKKATSCWNGQLYTP